jgi:hypothetical protein
MCSGKVAKVLTSLVRRIGVIAVYSLAQTKQGVAQPVILYPGAILQKG